MKAAQTPFTQLKPGRRFLFALTIAMFISGRIFAQTAAPAPSTVTAATPPAAASTPTLPPATVAPPAANAAPAASTPAVASTAPAASTPAVASTPPAATAAPATSTGPEVLTNSSIIQMKGAGLSSNVILGKISAANCSFTTDVNSLIQLKTASVDDDVINAMIKKGPQGCPCSQNSGVSPLKWGTMIDKESYISTNGTLYTVGQKVKIGTGSAQNNTFKYIMEFSVLNAPEYDKHVGSMWANQPAEISKIEPVAGNPGVIYLVFKDGPIKKYGISIEAAVTANELTQ